MNAATLLLALGSAVQALVGEPVPEWPEKRAERWVQGDPRTLGDLRGQVVLIRFFTDAACPYCRQTAPALDELQREFGPLGLVVIGMFTPKPAPRPVSAEEVRSCVRDYGFEFPVAIDDDWGALRTLWLDRVPGAEFTSASLLIDRRGLLRHVHEGGAIARDSDDPRTREDFRAMRSAIARLVSER